MLHIILNYRARISKCVCLAGVGEYNLKEICVVLQDIRQNQYRF